MEVIEISSSSSDEEEAEATSSKRCRVSSSDTIVISSSSDREDSPDNRKYAMKISPSRLARLREITKENMRSRDRHHALTENTVLSKEENHLGSNDRLAAETEFLQSPPKEPIQETVSKISPARKKLSFFKETHKSPKKLSPKLKQTTLSLDSFSPTKLCSTELSSGRVSDVPYFPPQHVIPSCLTAPNSTSQFFSEEQILFLECVYEEEVLQSSFIHTLKCFITKNHKPTQELVKKTLEVLLNSKKMSITSSCYQVLTIIQTLHPKVAACTVDELKWDFVQEIVEQLDLWQCFEDDHPHDHDNNISSCNAALALAFVVGVLEIDVRQKHNVRKSKAFHCLSTASCWPNVEKVVEWIREVVPLYMAPSLHAVISGPPGCSQDVLSLFQKLLKLAIEVSDNPVDSVRRITNGPLIWAYMHPSLARVECKTLLVESIQSHLLRSTFIELIFDNYCQDFATPSGYGLERILCTYFFFMPPSYSVESSSACRSQAECEEFVMLLGFLLQSYVYCLKTPLQALHQVEKHVQDLKERLETLCKPLSEKSYAFLNLMSLTKMSIAL